MGATLPAVALLPWERLTPGQQARVQALHISEIQLEFAGSAAAAVELTVTDRAGDITGLAIATPAHEVVGFLLLKRRGAAAQWAPPDAALIAAMRIDTRHQGRGLGAAALMALACWVPSHWCEIRSLCLAVDEGNLAGRKAYEKAGFQEFAPPTVGRIGWELYLSRPLAACGKDCVQNV